MKKIIAGGVVASALALGSLAGGGAAQAYSSDPAAAAHLKHKIKKVVHKKGYISHRKAHRLEKLVKSFYKAGVISKTKKKVLLAKLRADTK